MKDPDKLAYITQTTLSVDDTRGIIQALKERFPTIVGPDVRDICYATQNRQQAVRDLARRVDMILVVGSRNSSNSNRLREIGRGTWQAVLPDRRCRRAAARVVRRHHARSASPPVPRRRRRWCRACWTACAGSARSKLSTQDGVAEDVRFRFPAGTRRR